MTDPHSPPRDPAYYERRPPGPVPPAEIWAEEAAYPGLADHTTRILLAEAYRPPAGPLYDCRCPRCGQAMFQSYIEWVGAPHDETERPDVEHIEPVHCPHCLVSLWLEPRAHQARRQRELAQRLAALPDFPTPAEPIPSTWEAWRRFLWMDAYRQPNQSSYAYFCPVCGAEVFHSHIEWISDVEATRPVDPVVEIACQELRSGWPPHCTARLQLEPKARYDKRLGLQQQRDPADWQPPPHGCTEEELAAVRLAAEFRQPDGRLYNVHCAKCRRTVFQSYIAWEVAPRSGDLLGLLGWPMLAGCPHCGHISGMRPTAVVARRARQAEIDQLRKRARAEFHQALAASSRRPGRPAAEADDE